MYTCMYMFIPGLISHSGVELPSQHAKEPLAHGADAATHGPPADQLWPSREGRGEGGIYNTCDNYSQCRQCVKNTRAALDSTTVLSDNIIYNVHVYVCIGIHIKQAMKCNLAQY